MQQAGTQFWDSAIPYGHLQQWLLSLEVRDSAGQAEEGIGGW